MFTTSQLSIPFLWRHTVTLVFGDALRLAFSTGDSFLLLTVLHTGLRFLGDVIHTVDFLAPLLTSVVSGLTFDIFVVILPCGERVFDLTVIDFGDVFIVRTVIALGDFLGDFFGDFLGIFEEE